MSERAPEDHSVPHYHAPRRSPDLEVGEDGLPRTPWAYTNALMLEYYDTEWGMPVRDERGVFERLSLEVFQAGLSWETILRKRAAFRAAFANFSPDSVAHFDDFDRETLLSETAIVRNTAKIDATITNARATVALRGRVVEQGAGPARIVAEPTEVGGGLAELVWSYRPADTPRPMRVAEVPTASPESAALAQALKREGFQFVGPTNMYALMESLGIVDTHLMGSCRRGSSGVWAE